MKEEYLKLLAEAGAEFVADLEAMTHEALGETHGGESRSAYDFSYEVALVNERVAARLRGEDPGKWPFESSAVAPTEFRHKERALRDVRASIEAVRSAFEALDDSKLSEPIAAMSQATTYLKMFLVAPIHLAYHDGQLNYIQTMNGDAAVHWE